MRGWMAAPERRLRLASGRTQLWLTGWCLTKAKGASPDAGMRDLCTNEACMGSSCMTLSLGMHARQRLKPRTDCWLTRTQQVVQVERQLASQLPTPCLTRGYEKRSMASQEHPSQSCGLPTNARAQHLSRMGQECRTVLAGESASRNSSGKGRRKSHGRFVL